MYVIVVYICNRPVAADKDFLHKSRSLLLLLQPSSDWDFCCCCRWNISCKSHVIFLSLVLLCRWPSDWVVVSSIVNVRWLWFLNSNYVRWRTCPGFILSGGRPSCWRLHCPVVVLLVVGHPCVWIPSFVAPLCVVGTRLEYKRMCRKRRNFRHLTFVTTL